MMLLPGLLKKTQETGTPAQVQFELQAISAWRLQAGKPLSHIPFKIAVAKGVLNLLDPLENGILCFQPNQFF